MKKKLKVLTASFALVFLFIGSIYGQNYKKYLGFEYSDTKSILEDFEKLPGTYFNQEMKYAIEIFKDRVNGQEYLFFQRYFTVEGNQSHRKILDILVLEPSYNDGFFSAMCFPNENQQKDIILGLYLKKDKIESQIVVPPMKAWKTNYSNNQLDNTDPAKLQCLFGPLDDFPG